MKQQVLLIAFLGLCGCSLITEPAPDSLTKSCTLLGYTSQLQISFSSLSAMPEYFSASINGAVAVDECATGSPNRYLFKRHNDHNGTLTLYSWEDSPFAQLFFKPDGTPYDIGELDATIYGRVACDSDPIEIARIQKPISWTPVYPNGEGCGLGGYLGN